MHNLRVPSFFFTNNTSAPQGDTLGLMYPLSSISFNYDFNSTSSGVLIVYGAFDVGVTHGTNSMEKSTSL